MPISPPGMQPSRKLRKMPSPAVPDPIFPDSMEDLRNRLMEDRI